MSEPLIYLSRFSPGTESATLSAMRGWQRDEAEEILREGGGTPYVRLSDYESLRADAERWRTDLGMASIEIEQLEAEVERLKSELFNAQFLLGEEKRERQDAEYRARWYKAEAESLREDAARYGVRRREFASSYGESPEVYDAETDALANLQRTTPSPRTGETPVCAEKGERTGP